jgi:trans-aconitate 2-methyltransferase
MATPDTWNPDQYERFRAERAAPVFDLLALVRPKPDPRVVDLGCGTGEWTQHVHRTLSARATIGVDRSPAMLAKAGSRVAPGLTFELEDIGRWAEGALRRGDRYDLVFSNAALHWVSGHETLLGMLRALLGPGGQMAVQMPNNDDHPAHVVAREVSREPEFAAALPREDAGARLLAPEAYAALLHRLGFTSQHVRVQVYPHVLASRDEVIEWVRGSLLTTAESSLGPGVFARFLDRYRTRLFERLPDDRPFFYPFKRLHLWGQLASDAPAKRS